MDYTVGDTLYLMFTTRAFATGIPTALAGTPVVSAYENDSVTQITAGITLGVSHDSVVGMNLLTIVATGANGYESGKDYNMVITTGTVGGVSVVGEVVGTFSLGRSAAAVDLANGTDGLGALKTLIDDKTGYALSAAGVDAIWDEVLTGGTHNVVNSAGRRLRQLQEAGGYSGGGIYIDTVNGAAGTTNFENGVETSPSSNIADANTLAASLGISRFFIAPGSTITLAAAQENQEFVGMNWILALGGQSISNSHIKGAEVSGTATSAIEVHFDHCEIGACTLGEAHMDECDLSATITLSAAAEYLFIGCNHSGSAVIDFGAAVLNTTVHVHNYSGALTVNNMGQAGTDVLHFDSGGGKLTLAASCIGGTVNLNGTFDFVNSGSGLTINDDGAIIEVIGTPAGASVSVDNAAIKAVTDQMIFTKANELDVNTQSINGAAVVGDGNATPWDGA